MYRTRRRRQKPRILKVILYVIIGCAMLKGYLTLSDIYGFGKAQKSIVITIPHGAGLSQIADILKEKKVISHPKIFRFIVEKAERVYQQGNHVIDKSMSYKQIAEKLTQMPESDNNVFKVTIPEGFEARNIADELEAKGLIDRERFFDELEHGNFDYDFIDKISRKDNRLEGYLFPATYDVYIGESEHEIIDKMLKKFSEVVVPDYNKSGTEYSLDEIVTLASMIEREAANDSERGEISSVFYNRLDKGMTLSSCATVQYVIKERKAILSNSDIEVKSPYNTYKNKGLPIGPIAMPGERSILAALYPEATDYLYFAAKPDGSANVFSKTDTEHMQVVKELQGK